VPRQSRSRRLDLVTRVLGVAGVILGAAELVATGGAFGFGLVVAGCICVVASVVVPKLRARQERRERGGPP
jgi:hypothetical protein